MAYENTSNTMGSKIGRGITWTWNSGQILFGATLLAVCLFSVTSCFGLPSLVHQPSAHHIYDSDFTIESSKVVHPTDRLIHKAAECGLPYRTYMTPEGVSIARSAYVENAGSSNESGTRRSRRNRMFFEGIGLWMSGEAMRHAVGTRAAYRADQVDLAILRHLVDTRCHG